MPAPVPAGFTRGALVATGGHESFNDISTILQYFWQLAGSFGARIAIIPTASRDFGAAEQVRALFARGSTGLNCCPSAPGWMPAARTRRR
ncbi:hypothetical protein [Candidatus Amarolinea dominans]|uniref:hypothetical protein n=1 Tax=Candidatus Amarolinea dominans TaxID=3140696 RepID=UPI001D4C8A06|nr:hypothetical protein [Anaerolineae bacterium]